MAADLILVNLKAFAPGEPTAEAIVIAGERILAVGTMSRLGELKGPRTRVLDCQGGTAIPGFNDAHCHPLALAITLRHVDCSPARSIADLQAALRARAAADTSGRWLRAANYDPAALAEGRAPDRSELDHAVPDRPLVLIERAGQHCVLNSLALARCGLDAAADSSTAGLVHRDPISGRLNGMVSGNHVGVARAIPPLDQDEIEAGLREANQIFLAAGVTSLQDTGWSNTHAHWQAMRDYRERGLIAPRLALFAGIDALAEFAGRGLKTGSGDRSLRLGAAKIALDETLGNPDPPQEALEAAAIAAHRAGFQLAFHVPDVGLLRRSLRALACVRAAIPGAALRPRFEHCPACPPALMAELARSGATVVAQPGLLALFGSTYRRRLPVEQRRWLFPFNSFLAHGIGLAFGSDAPLTHIDPLRSIHAAVTRRLDGGELLGADEAIPMRAALQAFTAAGAYASGEKEEKGALCAGQLADIAVLDGPLENAESLLRRRVALTLIGGKLVWEH